LASKWYIKQQASANFHLFYRIHYFFENNGYVCAFKQFEK
jgi:hypothetical protein